MKDVTCYNHTEQRFRWYSYVSYPSMYWQVESWGSSVSVVTMLQAG